MLRNYSNDLDAIRRFVVEYAKVDDNIKVCPYVESMKAVANRTSSTFLVELDHLAEFDEELCEAVENNTMRYQKIFATTVDSMLPDYRDPNLIVKDALDVYVEQRIMSSAAHNTPAAATGSLSVGLSSVEENEQRSRFPPELLRRYEVSFSGRSDSKPLAVRDVLACKIGHLVQLRGVVTRAAEVKPLLRVATYTCDQCGTETYQEIPNPTFMPLSTCMNEACKAERNTAGGRLHLQTRGSKFLKFQELKVQELAEQVPVGNIPRSMSVYCRGENTRIVQPGDHVQLTGVFLPAVRSGFKQIAQGLLADTYLEAHRVQLVSQGNEVTDDGLVELTERELECLQDPDYFGTMARSLAPEIYGHEDIKKALLLMLVGGVDLSPRGMKIRGSINICLMGDPGVAKSQLLGFVHRLASRSQYTTGRGSSGVGLTAAIVKDTLTGEMTLEGGALVLADQGVCCIDEFDKMAEFDRTAIHEVMEQQTISIAKAGILTTLNARVSILAAANPAFGRYNPRKSVEQNVDLPAALLSRFDLLWLIQDKPDREHDLRLAQHIAYVHTHNTAPQTHTASVKGGLGNNETTTAQADEVLTMVQLRRLIQACRQLPPPSVPKALSDYLIGAYVELRKEARNNREMTYTSARTLLAILRLSTALARLRVSNEVSKYDIDEAMRLMEASRSSVQINDVAGANTWSNRGLTYRDHIYQVVRDMSCTLSPGSGALRVADIMERCAAKGFKPDQVNEVLDNYENLNVWHLNAGRSRLTMVN